MQFRSEEHLKNAKELLYNSGFLRRAPTDSFFGMVPFHAPFRKNAILGVRESVITGECNPPHSHDHIQLWYVHSGSIRHVVNGVSHTQTAHTMILVPPETEHYIDVCDSDYQISYHIDISDDFLRSGIMSDDISDNLFFMLYIDPLAEQSHNGNPIFAFEGTAAEVVDQAILKIYQLFSYEDPYPLQQIRVELITVLTSAVEQYRRQTTKEQQRTYQVYRDAMLKTLRYINDHCTEQLYIQDVCKIACMSPSWFSSIFKRIAGVPFVEHLLSLRLLRARDLLLETDQTIYHISRDCGFRQFTARFGMSPGQYRKTSGSAQ